MYIDLCGLYIAHWDFQTGVKVARQELDEVFLRKKDLYIGLNVFVLPSLVSCQTS